MKNIKINIFTFFVIVALSSCEKDIQIYNGKPTIYFNEAGRIPEFTGEVLKDSTILSFGLSGNDIRDSIVPMIITCIGVKADHDRVYNLQIDKQSTAIDGIHYAMLTKEFLIKKDQLKDTIFIKVFRLEEMKTKEYSLIFNLLENENFSVKMNDKTINNTTGQKMSFVNYKWYLNDIVKKPGRWLDGYLGAFSRKKLYLMVDVLGIEAEYLDKNVSIPETVAYGKYMQRYLNEQKSLGNIILDEDNTPMAMGSAVQ